MEYIMKKTFAKLLCLVLAVMLMVPCFVSCGETNYAENNTKIKIGVSGPLSGGAAVYGIAVKNAAQIAINEINAIEAAGGAGTLGMQFEFVAKDDEHKATNVSTTYSSLYESGMQISLGTVTTAPGLEFKELANDDNVFILTPSASGDDIPEYDNAFQMCFADSNQGSASAVYFNENYQGKQIGIFYKSDEDYSTGIRKTFLDALDASLKNGIKEASFQEGDNDFSSQVEALKTCDVIFMPIYYTPASQFMTKGKGIVKDNAIYYGCDGLDGIDAIDGFDITTVPQEVSYLSHFNSGATTGAAKTFIDKYNAAYNEETEPLNQFGAAAYDCVWAIYEALKVAKANGKEFDVTTSPADFSEILTEVFTSDSFTFHGITGKAVNADGTSNISWSDDGFVNKEAVKYVVKSANSAQ